MWLEAGVRTSCESCGRAWGAGEGEEKTQQMAPVYATPHENPAQSVPHLLGLRRERWGASAPNVMCWPCSSQKDHRQG